ncbi:hypothetical protein AALP_AA8G224400 [Arabis alpina]|uniref:Nuclear pore complex protein NUP1 n=1 Tax=Arabis alpina TaxID=50452 RepID=A0A087G8R2_ARAAL|nr:hypothetical protein AALP_AA8G224400 [Arabis alpina]
MASEEEATFPTAPATETNEAARGVGGKLKRQTARRHQSTPYSRPTQNQIQRRPWISRIVDPAYRIISGGARFLPYFFSNAASAPALTAPNDQDQQQHQDDLHDDPQENDPSVTPNLNKLESASIQEGGTSGTANVNESNFNINEQSRGKRAVDDVAVSELEKLMEGKTFSQAETDRLIEIINSRAIDLPDATRDNRLEMTLGEGAKKNTSFLDKRKDSIGGKDASSELWATPTPHAKSIVLDGGKLVREEAGLSPAELAKAYMGGQTPSSSSQGFVARNEKNCFDGGMLVGNSSAASPISKPSVCWPGMKSNEQSGFVTPQSQRESFGLQNLPRTPYSRSILSSSKSQVLRLQDNSSKRLSTLQSPSQSVQTRSGQLTLSKGREGGIFGPNRRSRQSATMSPYSRPFSGKSRYDNSAIMKSSEAEESSNLSRSQTTTYGKHKGSEVGTPTVPTHSSQKAFNILDKLERTQPTPKSIAAELKLATSWRYPQSSKTVEKSSSKINDVEKDASAKSNEEIQKNFSQNPPSSSSVPKLSAVTTSDTQFTMAKTASASNGIFSGRHASSSSGTTFQFELGKPKGPLPGVTQEPKGPLPGVTDAKDAAKPVPFSFGGEPANLPKLPSHSLGNNKPTLPSLSVAKPFQKWAVPSGSNASFTFPVSSSDGASASEPTTPSIMPFTTSPAPTSGVTITSHNHEATKDDEEIPQFGFDSKRRGDKSPLVFTFPSVSEEVIDEDDERLGMKFTFGSEKPERISFSSKGSDGVRC